MTTQALDSEFSKYWPKLSPVEKELLLTTAKNYVQLKEEIENLNIEQYNKEIDEAVARVEAGEFYTHEEVLKML
ncbi:MAG: hypothetical protein JWQ09_2415 [Segetibacter sp.]|nr:hypothetical protein [Segetibacter sp.]